MYSINDLPLFLPILTGVLLFGLLIHKIKHIATKSDEAAVNSTLGIIVVSFVLGSIILISLIFN